MKRVLFSIFAALFISSGSIAQIRDRITASELKEKIETDDRGYNHVSSTYYECTDEIGTPELPCISKTYYLPYNLSDCKLIVEEGEVVEVSKEFTPFPSQRPVSIYGNEDDSFVPMSDKICTGIYPQSPAVITRHDKILGLHLVTVSMYPYYYDGEKNTLYKRDIEISIEYTIDDTETLPKYSPHFDLSSLAHLVQSIVSNPDDVLADIEAIHSQQDSEMLLNNPSGNLPQSPGFIIITNEELASTFKRLADWKTRSGIPTVIETTEYISSHYNGIDLCEKIRNYIHEKENSWGTGLNILLGGDADIVPSREYNGYEFGEATDIYYVDFASWKPNMSPPSTYSEDINSFIGRFPASNAAEAEIMVEKDIRYEQANADIDYSYVNNNLISSAFFKKSGNTLSCSGAKALCDSTANLPRNYWYQFNFFNLSSPQTVGGNTYVYDSTHPTNITNGEELTRANFLSALADGKADMDHFHIIFNNDQGERTVMGTGIHCLSERITNDDVINLEYDNDYYQILLSTGWHTADFRTSCIGKSFLTREKKGGVAYFGNVDGGNSNEFSYGVHLFPYLYSCSSSQEACTLGNVWLKLQERSNDTSKKLHLLGDPTMRVWTDEPENITITKRKSGNYIMLTRSSTDRGKPWNACAYKENELFAKRSFSANEDTLSLPISSVETSGYIYLTYTGPNYKPVLDSLYVTKSGSSQVEITNIVIDDNLGNGDGVFASGETIQASVTFKNIGTTTLNNFAVQLDCENSYISLLDDELYMAHLVPNASIQKTFSFKILPNCPSQNVHCNNSVRLDLHITDDDIICKRHFNVDVYSPQVAISQYEVIELSHTSTYNYQMVFDVVNTGVVSIENPSFVMTSSSPTVHVTGGTSSLGTILPGDCGGSVAFFFSAGTPFSTSSFNFSVNMTDENNWTKRFDLSSYSSVPPAPSSGIVTLLPGDTYIDICWPTNSMYDYYVYQVRPSGTVRLCEAPISTGYYRDDNLDPQTTYTYKITSIDHQGVESNFSSSISATTKCELDDSFGKKRLIGSKNQVGTMVCWDVDRDGKMEVFSNYRNWYHDQVSFIAFDCEGNDIFINNDSKMLEDCVTYPSNSLNGPAIGELRDDGDQYVLMSTYSDDYTINNYAASFYANEINVDGLPLINNSASGTAYNSPRSIVLDDLDLDGKNEIIIPSLSQIQIQDEDMIPITTIIGPTRYRTIATGKVLPNTDEKYIIAPLDYYLKIYDKQGNIVADIYQSTSGTLTTPVTCDVDGDGYDEVIFGQWQSTTNSITIMCADYDTDGHITTSNLFTTSCYYAGRNDNTMSLGDLNNDGIPEVICYGITQVTVYDFIAQSTTSYSVNAYNRNAGYVLVADVDGDNNVELIYPSHVNNHSEIRAIKQNGSMAAGFPFRIDETVGECFLAADIDGDNKTELVIGEYCGQMSVYRTKGNADKIEWGTARGNAQNTGSYQHEPYPERVFSATYILARSTDNDIYVMGNALNVNNTLTMNNHHKVVVWENGVLNLNDATIDNAKVIVKDGGLMNISNDGEVSLGVNKSLKVDVGGKIYMTSGRIQ